MHDAVDEFADRLGLTDAERAELRRLTQPPGTAATIALDTLAPDGPVGEPSVLPDGLTVLGQIGRGGMGVVERVHDPALHRSLARKILAPEHAHHAAAVARFVSEAQTTAQLQHPGIVPVHAIGVLDDGRPYFTMREIAGQTLAAAIRDLRDAPGGLRRLVRAFAQVCDAVGYAHSRGVVHRDLKPDNVLLGDRGEVTVLDWGIAKVVGSDAADAPVRTEASAHRTRVGAVTGTPMYMSPEQALGQSDRIAPPTDVYALGAVLYEILAGTPPYADTGSFDVLVKVASGPPPPLEEGGRPVPAALVRICERAMARDPADRYPTAEALAAEVGAWLDGARRRDEARALVAQAHAAAPEVAALRARADAVQAAAEAALAEVPGWAPEEDKAPHWAALDDAAALREEAEARDLKAERALTAALQVDPELPEAHAAMAERLRAAHADAESRRDDPAVRRAAALLREHLDALPADHPVGVAGRTWLLGDGRLTLVTDPPGAEVEVHRYVRRNRRLVAERVGPLGATPLVEVPLAMGSYLLVIRHPGRAVVRYPVQIARCGHWDGVAPGGDAPTPVWLPPANALSPGAIYVPPGWFWSGGDPVAPSGLPARRLWCDGFVIDRHPVTVAEHLAFLNDLVARGDEAAALDHAPRNIGEPAATQLLERDADGRFVVRATDRLDDWRPDWPVLAVGVDAARAYLAWRSARTGVPVRLPGELEWEKAARGVDGRFYPWGDHLDPSWARVRGSCNGRAAPASITEHPVDCSPYGVRGMAGNAREWCTDGGATEPHAPGGRVVVVPNHSATLPNRVRGGHFDDVYLNVRCANRFGGGPTYRSVYIGFRGARPLPSPG